MEASDEGEQRPARPLPYARLTARERRRAAAWALGPIPVVALVLIPFAWIGPGTAGDVVSAALVYGGFLGLAAGFVYVDRVHARQCPRCRGRNPRDASMCADCGYDLEARPRYACDERHEIHLEPGTCACGRRLQPLPVARGIAREVAVILKVGGGLLAFLLAVGLVLQWLS